MITYFDKKDMVSFGNYLLSDERRKRIEASYEEDKISGVLNPVSVDVRMKMVHYTDIENWIDISGKKND